MTDLCLKCGKCCHYYLDGKFKRCKFLIDTKDGNTLCRIYSRRLGYRIDKNTYCTLRTLSQFDHEGCPYNTDKVMFPK